MWEAPTRKLYPVLPDGNIPLTNEDLEVIPQPEREWMQHPDLTNEDLLLALRRE